ncbi:MAG: hypothetical protein K2Z81_04920 [Cyanobacteria bacterium]|nr:hypothetical protein [Cyanobacteriota bacterium]
MKYRPALAITAPLAALLLLTSCAHSERTSEAPAEHYVSSQVQGEAAKINLTEVQKAFWDTKGKDFNSWMTAFEKRVNEIYEGKDIVSIDATRKTGKLTVTGFIDDKKEAGYQSGEEKLFTIEQTGDVTDNQLPYRISDHDNRPYYEGHHSIFNNPIVQMMVLSHLMGGWGGRYYTPYNRTVIIRDHRDSFRTTPSYTAQKTSNTDFNTRYKQKVSGEGFASKKTFGSSSSTTSLGTSSTSSRRSWGGFGSSSSSSSSSSSTSIWGGRRSPSFSGGMRGWGRRRR